MDVTTFGVLFRCAFSIGQIVHEHPGWALKQITLYSWWCNQQPRWILSWLSAPSLRCQVDTWTWSSTAEVRGSMLVILKVAWASHPVSTDLHFECFLFPPTLSSYARFTFPSSITLPQSSLWSLETSPDPRPLFILDSYCVFCLSHSHLLASPSSCCH